MVGEINVTVVRKIGVRSNALHRALVVVVEDAVLDVEDENLLGSGNAGDEIDAAVGFGDKELVGVNLVNGGHAMGGIEGDAREGIDQSETIPRRLGGEGMEISLESRSGSAAGDDVGTAGLGTAGDLVREEVVSDGVVIPSIEEAAVGGDGDRSFAGLIKEGNAGWVGRSGIIGENLDARALPGGHCELVVIGDRFFHHKGGGKNVESLAITADGADGVQ